MLLQMLYVLSLSPPEVAVKYFTSVHEFRLMTPGLSLAIVDARRRRIKPFENVDQLGRWRRGRWRRGRWTVEGGN